MFLVILAFGFSYGFFSAVKEIFPYKEVYGLYLYIKSANNISASDDKSYQWMPNNKLIRNFDVNDIIGISNIEDGNRIRNGLINYIWRNDSKPGASIVQDVDDIKEKKEFSYLNEVDSIIRKTVNMKLGFSSTYFRIEPKYTNNCLFIFHQGHSGDINSHGGKSLISKLVENGCTVLAMYMPFEGANNRKVIVPDKDFGYIEVNSHNTLSLIDTKQFSPVMVFVEPVISALTHELKSNNYNKVGMAGISGGGWTTVLTSAIDSRIQYSYSFSGSIPMYLRGTSSSWGDWEQYYNYLYRKANYLELYMLAALESNRNHIQIVNSFDPCCFSGGHYALYEKKLIKNLNRINAGDFRVVKDDTHYEHKISEYSADIILNDFLGKNNDNK